MVYQQQHEKTGFMHMQKMNVQIRWVTKQTDHSDFSFGYLKVDSIISPVPIFNNSSTFKPSSSTAQPGNCLTWSNTLKTGFLTDSSNLLVRLGKKKNIYVCFRLHEILK